MGYVPHLILAHLHGGAIVTSQFSPPTPTIYRLI